MLTLLLAGTGTALATGLGAIPVFLLGARAAALRPLLLGIAAGTMSVASVAGLLLPGLDEGSAISVGSGVAAGMLFLVGARTALDARDRHVERIRSAGLRTSILVFAVLLVHSLPEGFAIGTAYASDTAGLSLFVIVAIAVQNVPEGTAFLLVEEIEPLLPVSFGFAAGAMLALVIVELLPGALRENLRGALLGATAGAAAMLALSAALGV